MNNDVKFYWRRQVSITSVCKTAQQKCGMFINCDIVEEPVLTHFNSFGAKVDLILFVLILTDCCAVEEQIKCNILILAVFFIVE